MKIMMVMMLASSVMACAAGWTPVQLEIGPQAWSLFDEKTDVFGLRLAVAGKNPNVYGFDLSLDRAVVDKDFGGIQMAFVDDVGENASGIQLGVFHARAGVSCHGLQTALLWSETPEFTGGQIAIFNDAHSGEGFQVGLFNQTIDSFSGLSLAAVSVSGATDPAAQIGLLWNSVLKPSSGLQLGLIDRAEDYRGIQIGIVEWRKNGGGAQVGFYNDADNITGIQLGGASVAHSVHGAQIDLFGSGAYEVRGAQFGLVNIAGHDGHLDGSVTGVELGVLNRLGTLRGVQLGVLNNAHSCHGAQIGLVNTTDELHGLQVGILNLSGAGGLGVSPFLNFAF
jgi:hypothetical protein